ncbi:MAG: GxxExxY protein [Acidobacteria bacterium]|nr:GxxExxY protein [Acidobacteriota bacterium]
MYSLEPVPSATEDIGSRVIGCAIDVHRALGPGYLEHLYRRALCVELTESGLTYEIEKQITINYKGTIVGIHRLDLIIENCVLLELKAVESLAYVHKAQVLSYLRASGLRLGLLINFNVGVLKDGIRRIVFSESGGPST